MIDPLLIFAALAVLMAGICVGLALRERRSPRRTPFEPRGWILLHPDEVAELRKDSAMFAAVGSWAADKTVLRGILGLWNGYALVQDHHYRTGIKSWNDLDEQIQRLERRT